LLKFDIGSSSLISNGSKHILQIKDCASFSELSICYGTALLLLDIRKSKLVFSAITSLGALGSGRDDEESSMTGACAEYTLGIVRMAYLAPIAWAGRIFFLL
jgi:hypothetical protein